MNEASGASVCALGFDVGERWVGIAIGNSISQQARPLKVLNREQQNFWSDLERLIREWRPDRLVVGDPLTLAGEIQAATRIARRFARQLQGRTGIPTAMTDERASSREAVRVFAEQRRQGQARRRDAELQDAYAASIILQRWLDAGMPDSPPPDVAHEHLDSPPTDA
ncbi:Holliday junction resolvase RuvX [Pseudomarimonas arenosa]|uniref:Putative pre-16S rRNA nuclease n=1 Tax=Pseudomarimonas arenosa TaxID=2774145 RepID=A0AAW3ZJF1_9GAMM|nr:Holliday junction resolvase RuvX [Pseudomarimonas arenosa]MBD8525575.1 Holliday junction resolvase RuvX [Pseudomarimonas arenosa]